MPEYTQKDVQAMITGMIEFGDHLTVDVDGQVHWVSSPKEPISVPVSDGATGIIYTYTTNPGHPDAIIINPFAEGITASVDRNWFYRVQNVILAQTFGETMKFIVAMAANKEQVCPYPEILPYTKAIADGVDDKSVGEIQYILEKCNDGFCSIFYNSTSKESKLILGIEDESRTYQKSVPTSKVRKKTWTMLQNLVRAIFGTEGPVPDTYKSATAELVCPHFRTFCDVWYRTWKALAPAADVMYLHIAENRELDLVGDLKRLEPHFSRIDIYHKMCQWSSSVSLGKSVKDAVAKPVAVRHTAPPPRDALERDDPRETDRRDDRDRGRDRYEDRRGRGYDDRDRDWDRGNYRRDVWSSRGSSPRNRDDEPYLTEEERRRLDYEDRQSRYDYADRYDRNRNDYRGGRSGYIRGDRGSVMSGSADPWDQGYGAARGGRRSAGYRGGYR